jgi:hypothetical protein
MSYQQSWLRLAFICFDNDLVPKECECEKTVTFWYRYDNRVTVVAEKRDGTGGSKKAYAMVEDLAVVTYREESTASSLEVLDMVNTKVFKIISYNTTTGILKGRYRMHLKNYSLDKQYPYPETRLIDDGVVLVKRIN